MKNDYHRDSIDSLDTSSSLSADTINTPHVSNSSKSSSNSMKEDDYNSHNFKDDHYSLRPLKKRIIMSYKNAKDTLRSKTKMRQSRLDFKETKTQNVKHFPCNVCNNVYSSADLLRHHKYVHRRPHHCKLVLNEVFCWNI